MPRAYEGDYTNNLFSGNILRRLLTTEISVFVNRAPGISIDRYKSRYFCSIQVCRLQLDCLLGPQHVLGADPLLELVLGEVAEGDGLLLERGAVPVRRLGDLGRLVVADVGVERRHQHQGLVQQPADLLPSKIFDI